MLWTVLYECRLYLILIFACWLFAMATFLHIVLTGRAHLLDKKLDEFLTEFQGLAIATAAIGTLITYLIPHMAVRFIYHTFLA